jgi:predicted deacylase
MPFWGEIRPALLLGYCVLMPWWVYAEQAVPPLPVIDRVVGANSVDEQADATAPRVVAKEVDLDEPIEAVQPLQVQEETLVLPTVPQGDGPNAAAAPLNEPAGQAAASELPDPAPMPQSEAVVGEASAAEVEPSIPLMETDPPVVIPPTDSKPFVMLGVEVPAATSTRLAWSPSHSFEGIAVPTPVLVVNGVKRGHVLCLTAAVHGDELNGIEIVRRILYNLDADTLTGTVVGVPIVNLQGFRRGSRYLPDRRDLNRFFPGDPRGSSASRIAHSFFHEVISHCDSLVDLHTGSFYRTNLPQLRADLRDPNVLELTQGFDSTVVLHSEGAFGTLRKAAVIAGIPAVTLEAGEPMRLQEREVAHGVKSVQSLMSKLGMTKKKFFWGEQEPVYFQSVWVRSEQGGILFSEVELGERVKRDGLLGVVTDPITNVRTEIRAPGDGRVLGMAVDQVVMPGFATYRLGIPSDEERAVPSDGERRGESSMHTSQLDGKDAAPAETLVQDDESTTLQGQEDSE